MSDTLTIEDLLRLVTELRAHGFIIGVDRCIAARNLLDNAADTSNRTPAQQMTLLAPILCSSPEQQERFYLLYLEWLDRRALAAKKRGLFFSLSSVLTWFVERAYPARRGIFVAVLMAMLTLIVFEDEFFPRPPRSYVPAAQKAPPSPTRPPAAVSTTEPSPPAPAPASPTSKDLAYIDLVVEATPTFYQRNYIAIKMGTVSLPLVLLVVWFYFCVIRKRQLERRKAPMIPDHLSLRFASSSARLFADAEFRRARRSLRRHRRASVDELDLAATVDSTIRTGGWFTPVNAVRNVMPEYLVLVDRAGLSDLQTCYFDRLVDALVDEGVYVERYHFQSNPRACHRPHLPHVPVQLAELRALHPDHRLVILSDGAGLFNPIDDTPHRWVEEFAAWSTRALLTPEAYDAMSSHQRALRDAGFIVLPARPDGVIRLSRVVAARFIDNGRWESTVYPPSLELEGNPWLGSVLPRGSAIDRLRTELREYLGSSGYEWLAACALVPVVDWELTLHLGGRLLEQSHMERLLPALVRLPWMRHGSFPEWLRIELVAALSDAGLERMRAILDELLNGIDPVLGRIEIRMAGECAVDKEPLLYDYVASTVLKGKRPKQMTVAIPLALRKVLSPNDPDRVDARPVLLTMAATLCVVPMLFIVFKGVPDPIAPIATVTPVTITESQTPIEVAARGTPEHFFDAAELVVDGNDGSTFRDVRASSNGITGTFVTSAAPTPRTVAVQMRRNGVTIGSFLLEVR